jgi:hypothetical protein
LTRLVAALALSALALAACNKGATNSNNANNSNNSNSTSNSNAANKNSSTTASGGDFATPTSALQYFYAAAQKNDVEAVKRSMSKKSLQMIEKSATKENKTVDESLKELIKDAPSTALETRNEKITGEKATIEVKDDKMDKWDTVPLVREDGQWKIALLDEMADAMDKMGTDKK